MVVRCGIEPPTPRSSGTRYDANWPDCGERREVAVAEAIVGWTDLDRGAPESASLGTPTGGVRRGRWRGTGVETFLLARAVCVTASEGSVVWLRRGVGRRPHGQATSV